MFENLSGKLFARLFIIHKAIHCFLSFWCPSGVCTPEIRNYFKDGEEQHNVIQSLSVFLSLALQPMGMFWKIFYLWKLNEIRLPSRILGILQFVVNFIFYFPHSYTVRSPQVIPTSATIFLLKVMPDHLLTSQAAVVTWLYTSWNMCSLA